MRPEQAIDHVMLGKPGPPAVVARARGRPPRRQGRRSSWRRRPHPAPAPVAPSDARRLVLLLTPSAGAHPARTTSSSVSCSAPTSPPASSSASTSRAVPHRPPTEPQASASSSRAVPPYPPPPLSTRIGSSRPPPPTLVAAVPVPVHVHVQRRRRFVTNDTRLRTNYLRQHRRYSQRYMRQRLPPQRRRRRRQPRPPRNPCSPPAMRHRRWMYSAPFEVKYEQYRLLVFALNLCGTGTFTDQSV